MKNLFNDVGFGYQWTKIERNKAFVFGVSDNRVFGKAVGDPSVSIQIELDTSHRRPIRSGINGRLQWIIASG